MRRGTEREVRYILILTAAISAGAVAAVKSAKVKVKRTRPPRRCSCSRRGGGPCGVLGGKCSCLRAKRVLSNKQSGTHFMQTFYTHVFIVLSSHTAIWSGVYAQNECCCTRFFVMVC